MELLITISILLGYFMSPVCLLLLVRKFNKQTKSKFPAILYLILSFIPFVFLIVSYLFIRDIYEYKIKIGQEANKPVNVYLSKIFFPYMFSSIGGMLFVVVLELFLGVLMNPIIVDKFVMLAEIIPFLALIFLIGGFIFLKKEIEGLDETKANY